MMRMRSPFSATPRFGMLLLGLAVLFVSPAAEPAAQDAPKRKPGDVEPSKKTDTKKPNVKKPEAKITGAAALPPGAIRRLPSASDVGKGHGASIYNLAFSPDGRRLASRGGGLSKKRVRIWDAVSGKMLHILEADVWTVFSGDGKTLITVNELSGNKLRFWDVETGELLKTVDGQGLVKKPYALLPNGRELVAIFGGVTKYFDVQTGSKTKEDPTHRRHNPLAFSPDGKVLAYLGNTFGKRIYLCEAETGKEYRATAVLDGKDVSVKVARFSPDSRFLAAGGHDKLVHLWTVTTPQRLLFTLRGQDASIWALAFSRDGRFLVSGGGTKENGKAVVWDLLTGQIAAELQGHADKILAVAFSADGTRLATGGGSRDKTILLWDFWQVALGGLRSPQPLVEAKLQELWNDLQDGQNARRSLAAVGTLVASAQQALPFVERQLENYVRESQRNHILDLVKQLDDDEFQVREKATAELMLLRKHAEALLRKSLVEATSQEVRFRLRTILSVSTSEVSLTPSEIRRYRRVVLMLERIATPRARKLLLQLEESFPSKDVNRDASQARKRLAKATAASK